MHPTTRVVRKGILSPREQGCFSVQGSIHRLGLGSRSELHAELDCVIMRIVVGVVV